MKFLDFFFYANLCGCELVVCAVHVVLPTLLLSNDKEFCLLVFVFFFFFLIVIAFYLTEYSVICVIAVLTVCEYLFCIYLRL